MDRLVPTLLFRADRRRPEHGYVAWNADRHTRDDADRHACLQRAQATTTIALLTPSSRVGSEGRLTAIEILGTQVDEC